MRGGDTFRESQVKRDGIEVVCSNAELVSCIVSGIDVSELVMFSVSDLMVKFRLIIHRPSKMTAAPMPISIEACRMYL